MKKVLSLLLVVLFLAGCTGGVAESPTPQKSVQSEIPCTPAAEEEETLVVYNLSEETLAVFLLALGENCGFAVERAPFSDAGDEQMMLDFAAGRATYDVIALSNWMGNLYTMDGLMAKGCFAPLDDIPRVSAAVGSMWPVLQEAVTQEGRIYGLPYMMGVPVMTYDHLMYEAAKSDTHGAYFDGGGHPVSKTALEKLPPQMAFSSWEEMLDAEGFEQSDRDLLCITLLEQYMLGHDAEGFRFDCPEFITVLEHMKRIQENDAPVNNMVRWVNTAVLSHFIEEQNEETQEIVRLRVSDDVFALPTIDPDGKLPMTYNMLVINAQTEKMEEARRFLAAAAEIGLNGWQGDESALPDFNPFRYGTGQTAMCYNTEAHLVEAAGEEPDNRQRWRDIVLRTQPVSSAGFLTSWYLDVYPMYLDGAISAEACARQTQQRYEMFLLENGQ